VLTGFRRCDVVLESLGEHWIVGKRMLRHVEIAWLGRWSDVPWATIRLASYQSFKGVFRHNEEAPYLRRKRGVDQDKLRAHAELWVTVKIRRRSHVRDIGSQPLRTHSGSHPFE
jgi:hypothetical protein